MIGKIFINGDIGTMGDDKGIELIDVITQVRKQPDATSYEVHINSDGGIVDVGFDIYNFIKSLGLPITTIGSGTVASIATIIFMAGDTRIVKPNTQFMIHLPMGGVEYATSEEMEIISKQVKEIENKIIGFYSKNLGLNKEAIVPLLKNETWLNAQQLLDLGFVTTNSNVRIAARVIKNKNKMSKKTNKFQEILKILRGDKVVMKTIFSADNKELVFSELEEDAPIEEGAKATFDGMPAEGEITGADGIIYVFEMGVLKEIKQPMAEEETTSEEIVEALTATLEVAAELSERVSAVETEVVGLKIERDEYKTKFENAQAIIAKLKGSSKTVETDPKEKETKKESISSVVAQWKLNKKLKKVV